MKTIKPQKLSVLVRTFENDGDAYFVATVLAFFPFSSPRQLLPEVALWPFVAEELGRDAILDECMSKRNGELLVAGKAYSKGRVPRTVLPVRVRVGSVDKSLYVVGDRTWSGSTASEPLPFTEMSLTWDNAFGGEGFPQNPRGKGFAPVKGEDGKAVHALPNVEDPKRPVASPRERPAPAGLRPYELTWPQRYDKVGTYDDEWLKTRYPGFAADFDWDFFQTAPPDQRIAGYFRGDEAFSVENMHPEKSLLESRLPGLLARCFVTQKTPEGEVFRELVMRAETVWLFPNAERGVVVFRGVVKIAEDDGADIVHLLAGCDALEAPRPVEHYREVLAQRLDKKKGYLHVLRDGDLLPAPEMDAPLEAGPETASEMEKLLAIEGLLRKNARRKAELELDRMREEIRAMGLDPEPYVKALPPEEPPPRVEDIGVLVERAEKTIEEEKEREETMRAELETELRATCEEHGLDYDELRKKGEDEGSGPPKFTAKGELERLRDLAQMARNGGVELPDLEAKLADPEFEQKLVDAEQKLRDAYRRFGHFGHPAPRQSAEASAALRAEILAARERGESLARRDLTGADLSSLDLEGADLAGALLERANLASTRLQGADLTNAVLARADLTNAVLDGAKMAGANLGVADLTGASLDRVDLSNGVLTRATLCRTSLRDADLSGADLLEIQATASDLAGADLSRVNFISADLRGISLAKARARSANFIKAKLDGVDLEGADLEESVFLETTADGAVFRDANLKNLRVAQDCSFAGANFVRANLELSTLRATRFSGCDFSEARLDGADFSESDLTGANFFRAVAKDSRFHRADLTGAVMMSANLMQASLQKATLAGTDLRGANLFRGDLAKVKVDGSTDLLDANMRHARVVLRRPSGPG